MSGVRRIRKKPVEVDGIEWTGENWTEVELFAGEKAHYDNLFRNKDRRRHIFLEVLGGHVVVNVGDWIIRGVKGEFYPCKPDIFEQTYEVLE